MEQKAGLNGNALKIIALVTMTIDHAGLMLLHDNILCRILGRLAFPIFAYMIAEGCRYTKNKRNYFLRIFILGLLCQAAYYITERNMYQGILMTFSVSILLCYVVLWVQKKTGEEGTRKSRRLLWGIPILLVVLAAILCGTIDVLPKEYRITFDYGFWGIMLPVWIVLGRKKWQRLILAAVGLSLIAADPSGGLGNIQWYAMAALILLACYNEQRGKWNLKYLFYIYYPLHMAVIYGLTLLYR